MSTENLKEAVDRAVSEAVAAGVAPDDIERVLSDAQTRVERVRVFREASDMVKPVCQTCETEVLGALPDLQIISMADRIATTCPNCGEWAEIVDEHQQEADDA